MMLIVTTRVAEDARHRSHVMTAVRKAAGQIVVALGLLIYAIGLSVALGGTPPTDSVAPSTTEAFVVAVAQQHEAPSCCIDYSATSCAYSCAAHCSQALDAGGAAALSPPMLPISIDPSYDSICSIDGDLMFRPPRPVT
jgi:hypothetical protein